MTHVYPCRLGKLPLTCSLLMALLLQAAQGDTKQSGDRCFHSSSDLPASYSGVVIEILLI